MKTILFTFLVLIHASFVHCATFHVVTAAHGEMRSQEFSKSAENKQAYCEKHDYSYTCFPAEYAGGGNNLLALIDILQNSSCDWIFWTDARSIITNTAVKLEDYIDEESFLIISKDNGTANPGHFLLRNCQESHAFIERAYQKLSVPKHPVSVAGAFTTVLANDEELDAQTRFVPRRLFASSPVEIKGGNVATTFQTGDFLLDFSCISNLDEVRYFLEHYMPYVVHDTSCISIDSYLGIYGHILHPRHSKHNEGYMSWIQKKGMIEVLKNYPPIEKIAEIGLNGGHSLDTFVKNCPSLKQVVSFDINHHAYTRVAAEYFQRFYRDVFVFEEGDSLETVPEYVQENPEEKFDLIYIDGNHSYDGCMGDILNCIMLATPESILWIDDYYPDDPRSGVGKAVNECIEGGLIEVLAIHPSHDPAVGRRCWVEARYLFPEEEE